jgi:endoglucanase
VESRLQAVRKQFVFYRRAIAMMAALLLPALPALAGGDTPSVPPAGFVAAGFVHVVGKGLVGPDGEPFAIKGIGFGNWLMPEGYMFKFHHALSPRQINAAIERVLGPDGAVAFWNSFRDSFIAEDDIRFLGEEGFTVVRVALHYGLFVDAKDPSKFEGPGYRLLDRLIAWSRAAGLHVILDMHAAPGGQTGVNHDDGTGYPLMFYVPRYRAETVALWQHLAARYRDEPAVLGYDLLNEPISPYHDAAYLNPRLEPTYREIVAAIRAVDPNHMIFLAGAQWSTNFAVFGRPFAPNIVYTYHKFWSNTRRDAIQAYLNFSNLYDVPLFLGETGELNDGWNEAFRRLNDEHKIGWSFWTYKNLDSPSTLVSIQQPAGWDAVIAFADDPPDPASAEAMALRARAATALADYLEAIKFGNAKVSWSYLASLGLGPGHDGSRSTSGPELGFIAAAPK